MESPELSHLERSILFAISRNMALIDDTEVEQAISRLRSLGLCREVTMETLTTAGEKLADKLFLSGED